MKDFLLHIRSRIIWSGYRYVLKPIFFRLDPEDVHDHTVAFGARLGKYALTRALTRGLFYYSDSTLSQDILGIKFINPVGLAAGFDKNAELTEILPSVGFGFVEVGSITGHPCAGNPKPRLWRLKKSKGLVVYYGLKNDGCEIISKRLSAKVRGGALSYLGCRVGTSVAMTNCAANVDYTTAILDYAKAFKAFDTIGDYFTINISCPNAENGQPFLESQRLEALLTKLDTISTTKLVFIKLSPDITLNNVDAILDVAKRHRVHGIICTNLTKKRNNARILDANLPSHGGVSGLPVQGLSDDLIAHIYKREGKRFVLVGCGGIFSAEDAYRKIRLGASLVQLITGMIFEGPQLVSEINRGLVKLTKRDGYTHISEVIGVDVR